MRPLLILPCGGRKLHNPEPLPALQRYDGPFYRTLRAHARLRKPMPDILILSAKYGLIEGHEPILDYDTELTRKAAEALVSDMKARQVLRSRIETAPYSLSLAGKHYHYVLGTWAEGLELKREPRGIGFKLGALKSFLMEITS